MVEHGTPVELGTPQAQRASRAPSYFVVDLRTFQDQYGRKLARHLYSNEYGLVATGLAITSINYIIHQNL